MKHLVFAAACLGVLPLAFLLSRSRRWLRVAFAGVVAAMCLWNATSISFFVEEGYRGTSRGLDVSLAWLASFVLLFALAFARRLRGGLLPDAGSRLYLLYALLCLPSLTAAESLPFAFFELWTMAMLLVFYAAVANYLRATDDVRTVLAALAVFAVANFLAVVRGHVASVYQPHGVFPHQNSMAVAMHLFGCLFLAGYLAHGVRTRFGRLCALAFLCAAAATARSYSRMALALMPLGYGIAYLACVVRVRPRRWLARTVPLALAGAVALAVMLPRFVERFETAPEESGSTRVELARCAREMILDEPLRGVGLNNWGLKINPPWDYAERAGRIHDWGEDHQDALVETVYLLVAAECGIPALLALLAWFGWYWALCVRLLRRLRGRPEAFVPAGLLGGLTIAYAQSCFEWVFRQPLNLVCLMLCYALLSHLARRPLPPSRRSAETACASPGSVQ